jgi:hypothetical protein
MISVFEETVRIVQLKNMDLINSIIMKKIRSKANVQIKLFLILNVYCFGSLVKTIHFSARLSVSTNILI